MPTEFADSVKTLKSQSERFLIGQCGHPPEAISAHEQARLSSSGLHELTHHRSASMGNLDGTSLSLTTESPCHRMDDNGRAPGDFAPKYGTHGEVQLIEQFEPGVYVTLIQLRDGTKVFKRVRFRYSIPAPIMCLFSIDLNLIKLSIIYIFTMQQPKGIFLLKALVNLLLVLLLNVFVSKRRFAEQQAEEWWRENQERVFRKYNHAPN